jgi:hypothetical protein
LPWLDKTNVRLDAEPRLLYERLGLPAEAFHSGGLYAPARRADAGHRRPEGVRPSLWTTGEFARDRLLRFAFVEAEANRGQLSFVIVRVERALEGGAAADGARDDPAIELDNQRLEMFDQLVELLDHMSA